MDHIDNGSDQQPISHSPESASTSGNLLSIILYILLGLLIIFVLAYLALSRTPAGQKLLGLPVTSPTSSVTETPLPTDEATLSASPTSTTTPIITNQELLQAQSRFFLDESEGLKVYLINFKTVDNQKTGQLVILDGSNQLHKTTGTYSFTGNALVSKQGNYLSLSSGVDTKRTETLISLNNYQPSLSGFCLIGQPIIWNDNFIIYNSCDIFANRPWSGNIAPSIDAKNIKTGFTQVLFRSTTLQHFGIKSVSGNILNYYRTYVENSADWNNQSKIHTITATYDLSKLN